MINHYQHFLTFQFAVDEINKNPHLLPNLTLGYQLLNNFHNYKLAVESSLIWLSGNGPTIPNYRCDKQSNSVAVIGGLSSTLAMAMATILTLYKAPQISYGLFDLLLADKVQYPYVYQMGSKQSTLHLAFIQLMLHFDWNWVGVVLSDDTKGEIFFSNLKEEMMHHFLKCTNPVNNANDKSCGNGTRMAAETYDILNFKSFPDSIETLVKVGQAIPLNQEFSINEEEIDWPEDFSQSFLPYKDIVFLSVMETQTPTSICSLKCGPGFKKTILEDQPICCFDCIACPQGKISNHTGEFLMINYAEECLQCSEHQYPNKKRDRCLPRTVTFLAYEEPLGMTLACAAICFSLLTVLVLGVFLKHRDTPIVKANNRSLSYTLLVSLSLCFLCSLLFIGHPTTATCLLRQTTFAVVFTVAVSSILAKTITVVLAFRATRPGSRLQSWLGSTTSYSLIFTCTLIQMGLCGIWLGTYPPFLEMDIHSEPGSIIIQCNEGSLLTFYCVLGYMALLALASFTVAFLARNLPDTFNEAKFLTFSMLVFCSVWISFLPSYQSSKGKAIVALEVFAILTSSAGILTCIFAPKCFVILLRSKQNTIGILKKKVIS
ncbi:vomeronasal type-2 receptor 26-like [Sminthopsis crassicaudata]|uniref:vomeronasal type-2 receptor 26-like n=1 Tax=Sminthopsis crassicaudata TaxID=9301 RepID=UPI003D694158